MLKKNLLILWTPTEYGMIIQNLKTNIFFELDEIQENIWAYIDGTNTEEDIIKKLVVRYTDLSPENLTKEVNDLILELTHNDLIISK